MANQDDIIELINQSISCEQPYIYGTVNLNRLRDVLCMLVSTRRTNDELLSVNNSDELEIESEKGLADTYAELPAAIINNDSMQNIFDLSSSNLHEINSDAKSIKSSCSPSLGHAQETTTLFQSTVLSQLDEIWHKIDEINQHISEIETKVLQIEPKSNFERDVTEIELDVNTLKSNASPSDLLSSKSATFNATNKTLFTESSEPEHQLLNDPSSQETVPGNVPTTANEPTGMEPTSVPKLMVAKEENEMEPNATNAVDVTKQEQVDGNSQDVDKTTKVNELNCDEIKVATNVDNSKNYENLEALVAELLERQKCFSNCQATIEQTVAALIEKFERQFEQEKSSGGMLDYKSIYPNMAGPNERTVPGSEAATVHISESDLRNVQCQNVTNHTSMHFESEICTAVPKIREELLSIHEKFNKPYLKSTAGGIPSTKSKQRVQSNACNSIGIMNVNQESVPMPAPFYTDRCLKPYLREKLNCLRKELKNSALIPVDMQPYYRFIKKK